MVSLVVVPPYPRTLHSKVRAYLTLLTLPSSTQPFVAVELWKMTTSLSFFSRPFHDPSSPLLPPLFAPRLPLLDLVCPSGQRNRLSFR